MTLKEKVMQVNPRCLDERYLGGVIGCPAEYPYLNDDTMQDGTPYHGCDRECIAEKCAECWNREYVPANGSNVPTASKLPPMPEVAPPADAVNHPEHYTRYKHECIDEMIAMFGVDAVKAFCRCNAYKYRYRAGAKGDAAEDLAKAEWYMDKLIQLEKEGVKNGENS